MYTCLCKCLGPISLVGLRILPWLNPWRKAKTKEPAVQRENNLRRRSLTNVYLHLCPCGVNQGTCEDGICT
ncbi:hypothetical protein MTO96_026579 [Rhipicephalus appendiculatus]